MEVQHPTGPLCQSCGMPMMKQELFGTESDGSKSTDYCIRCYSDGSFTEPDITMEQMIEKVTGYMVEKMKMERPQAEGMAKMFIPRLKRWKGQG